MEVTALHNWFIEGLAYLFSGREALMRCRDK